MHFLHYPHFQHSKVQKMQKVQRSLRIFRELPSCTPCTLAHFQNAKVPIMPGGIFRNSSKRKNKPCKSARNAWSNNGKNDMVAMRKNIVNPILARYLLSFSKGVIRSRWSVDFIIVTTVTTTKKGNEKRRKARICFGIPFHWKIIASTAVTAVTALFVFSLP